MRFYHVFLALLSCINIIHALNIDKLSKSFIKPKFNEVLSKIMIISSISLSLSEYSSPVHAKVIDQVNINRFQSGLVELENLDKNWNKIATNGDNIRRILGTVYSPPSCDSPLCSSETFINKFVRRNVDTLDFDSFDPISQVYLQSLTQADFLAYSSNFADYGNGGGKSGEDYLRQSHDQIKRAISKLREMIDVINQD